MGWWRLLLIYGFTAACGPGPEAFALPESAGPQRRTELPREFARISQHDRQRLGSAWNALVAAARAVEPSAPPWERVDAQDLAGSRPAWLGGPGPSFIMAHGPELDGEIVWVDGDVCIVRVTREDDPATSLGVWLAVYRLPEVYVGEAAVVARQEEHLACRVVLSVTGRTPRVGDLVSANAK